MNQFENIKISPKHMTFYKITKKIDFLTKAEACASPPSTCFKEKLRFLNKGEICASHRKYKFKNIEFCLIRVRHVPHLQEQA